MISIDIQINDKITGDIKRIKRELLKVPRESLAEYKRLTPIDTGNARRRTYLESNKTIRANYPYAQRLDEGWSNQARQGMTRPWEQWFRNKIRKIMGR